MRIKGNNWRLLLALASLAVSVIIFAIAVSDTIRIAAFGVFLFALFASITIYRRERNNNVRN